MNNEFIDKGEAIETALKLSKKNSNIIYVLLSNSSYFITDSIFEGTAGNPQTIAKFKNGVQVWPISEPDLPVPDKKDV